MKNVIGKTREKTL